MHEYNTLFYESADGKIPAKDFLLTLDYDMRAKMIRTLELLQRNGPSLREPQSKELEDGIFELRARVGTNISRLLYFYDEGQVVLLTNGFIKKHPVPQSHPASRSVIIAHRPTSPLLE